MADNIVEILVRARDQAAPDLIALKARLDALSHEVATARAEVNDAGAAAKLDALDARLIALGRKVSNPKITVEGAVKAEAEIHAVEAALEKLNGKEADTSIRTAGLAGMLMRLGGAAGGAAGPVGGLGGALGGMGPVGYLAAAGLAAMLSPLAGIVSGTVAAGLGLGSFAALAVPTLQKLMTNFSALQQAVINYGDASQNLNTAIHRSAADWAAYQKSIQSVEPDLRSAAALLTNQNVLWQNLTPAMQANVIALSNNKAQLRLLLPDQKAALTALLAQADAWGNLSPAQQKAAVSLQSLQGEFRKLVAAVAPLTFQVFNDGIKIANTLLPHLLPFAQAAGTALDGLLKQFDRFAQSPGFKQWMQQMLAMSGPWITAIGQGLGQLVVAVGKFLISISNPTSIRAFMGLIRVLAAVIVATGDVIHYTSGRIVSNIHAIASSFDAVRRAFAETGHFVAHIFDDWRHFTAAWFHDIAHYFGNVVQAANSLGTGIASVFLAVRATLSRWAADTGTFIGKVVQFFQQLPGRILAALAALPGMLFSAGQHAMSSLISGFTSMIGSLGSAIGGIASKVAGFFGLSPAKEGPLSGGGSPFIRGQHFAADFTAGMLSGQGALAAAAARLAGSTGTTAPGGAGGGSGAAGGGGWVEAKFTSTGSSDPIMRELIAGLKLYVRTAGGGGPNSAQRALGQ